MTKKDGHTHSRFSHHGSQESLAAYVEQAINQGFTEYTITEHAPLPKKFLQDFVGPIDECLESAMTQVELPLYRAEVDQVADQYRDRIKIKHGLEVDYLPGYEQEIREFINHQASWLDEIILSVHFMTDDLGDIRPIDYSEAAFGEDFASELVQPQKLFDRYYQTVAASLGLDFDSAITVRVGHMTLIRKYQHYFNLPQFDENIKIKITEILRKIKAKNWQIDFNAAGLSKPYNGESYPTETIVKEAVKIGIPMVYGSDAHDVASQGLYYEQLEQVLLDCGTDFTD
ncbi:histidinol-phosphatase HisJ [Fructobacillus ficulneus]|uniref:Histidinol-phosphatase n=1 Tax=Fructobacillus ficulneus TaxID=157463 RepID=A0A0K8MGE8_9LACO|nr:histidinol-phosphatase HisJ [Fructobacillus ficulneus]GAO99631.1 histidinol phosphate phosphatase HisJ family [Fructobacillus ficulneus]